MESIDSMLLNYPIALTDEFHLTVLFIYLCSIAEYCSESVLVSCEYPPEGRTGEFSPTNSRKTGPNTYGLTGLAQSFFMGMPYVKRCYIIIGKYVIFVAQP